MCHATVSHWATPESRAAMLHSHSAIALYGFRVQWFPYSGFRVQLRQFRVSFRALVLYLRLARIFAPDIQGGLSSPARIHSCPAPRNTSAPEPRGARRVGAAGA